MYNSAKNNVNHIHIIIMKQKFIIFAHARSGSTNLSVVLEQYPQLTIASEPFHKDYQKKNPNEKNYIDFINDEPSLDTQLDELFNKYTGLKILEYQLSEKLNTYLLENPSIKVIFLQRKNLLQTIVSEFIASQTNVWYKRINVDLNPSSFPKFEPINIDKMKNRLEMLSSRLKNYQQILKQRQESAFLSLCYEDFYTSNKEKNIENAAKVFAFLGIEMPETSKISQFMNPKIAKMNTQDTYRLIPNIDEVETVLGNDQTGWLFK